MGQQRFPGASASCVAGLRRRLQIETLVIPARSFGFVGSASWLKVPLFKLCMSSCQCALDGLVLKSALQTDLKGTLSKECPTRGEE